MGSYPDEENISNKESYSENEEFDIIGIIVSNSSNGVEIKKIDKKSNAYRSGLRSGDIILSIENKKIESKNDY